MIMYWDETENQMTVITIMLFSSFILCRDATEYFIDNIWCLVVGQFKQKMQ